MSRPTSIRLAALSLAFAAAGSAHAAAYQLSLQGTDQRTYPPCRVPGQPGPCDTTVVLPWTGTLGIVIDSDADGVFGDADVTSFVLHGSLGTFGPPSIDPGSVTVDGGQVTSVDFGPYPDGTATYAFRGLDAYYEEDYDAGHEVTDEARGVLVAVAEPASAALVSPALALAWAAGAVRSHRRRRAPIR